ncbi:large ribosomal subunit protein bL32m [Onthophagus taurus]|uniref:large ribosomal subunit protein bL32m n=1 Tax=Onthophagus taurus TaxID=166361 RepID=UPI0039BEB58A
MVLRLLDLGLRKVENAIFTLIFRRFPPSEGYCVVGDITSTHNPERSNSWSLKELIGDGWLWAVPKSRRSIEKRLKRKYGSPDYNLKILLPKNTLRTCNTCGDDHEVGVLCPTCYKKVIEETKAMQDKIQEELKLEPVEKEVVVLYDGEKDYKPSEFFEGKRIIEMKKPRPNWFSKNLTEKTTQQPATTSDVKPSGLG